MRKTDKKIDNQLRLVLTDVCEVALKEIDGLPTDKNQFGCMLEAGIMLVLIIE